MSDIHYKFHEAYALMAGRKTVYTANFPMEMKASEKDSDGWIEWKLIGGTLQRSDYHVVEKRFGIHYPESFIAWHKAYYFLDADCSLIRLPHSNPKRPLEELIQNLNWFIAGQLIPQKLYPFGDDGNDAGPLVFDAREPVPDNEFPVRVYDHEYGGDLAGLSEIIFSSFPKLLECISHFMIERQTRKDFEIIPEFFQIDPEGAGGPGKDYWLSWVGMLR